MSPKIERVSFKALRSWLCADDIVEAEERMDRLLRKIVGLKFSDLKLKVIQCNDNEIVALARISREPALIEIEQRPSLTRNNEGYVDISVRVRGYTIARVTLDDLDPKLEAARKRATKVKARA